MFYDNASISEVWKTQVNSQNPLTIRDMRSEPVTELPLIRFAKCDEDVYPCSLVMRSGWNPPLRTPAFRRLRLLHAWIIERETREEPTDTFIDFPREEGENSVGWAEEGDKEERWRVLMIKKAFLDRKR